MAVSQRAMGGLKKEELAHLLQQMQLLRRFEEKAAEMYARGRIRGSTCTSARKPSPSGRFRYCGLKTTS
jgi:TPP-dependent pyruvate/acetoin dehydrogenase alpha subunit